LGKILKVTFSQGTSESVFSYFSVEFYIIPAAKILRLKLIVGCYFISKEDSPEARNFNIQASTDILVTNTKGKGLSTY